MKRWLLRPLTLGIVCASLILTVALTWVVRVANQHTNHRLLDQQVQQAAAALSAALPATQSHLLDAAQVAIATKADPQVFQRFMAPQLAADKTIASVSLWQLNSGTPRLLATAGQPPLLVSLGRAEQFFSTVRPSKDLLVAGILPGTPRRVGYAVMPDGETAGLAVYAEQLLPPSTRVGRIPASSPFADLDFAFYLGDKPVESQLVEATTPTPIKGHTASATVPFGNTSLLLVATTNKPLAGGLSQALWWIVLAVGCALSLASGFTLEYVGRRRVAAEALAAENERLYVQQKDIAATLQHALLPELPSLGSGVEVAARYLAGSDGLDVGGDWYDVIRTDDDRCLFFVGDVSGRGLKAATTMASLRFAIRAYVVQGDPIDVVLLKIGDLLDIERDNHFATVLAGEIDFQSRRATFASAGHFMPLLVSSAGAELVAGEVAPPIGVGSANRPPTSTVQLPPDATMLAFTDGVVERKGELIDIGLDRLCSVASADDRSQPLEKALDLVLTTISPDGVDDDAVLLGLRWQN